jgi:hypothetical protein
VGFCGLLRSKAKQSDAFAPLDLHAQLQAFEPVQAIYPLLAHLPAFPLEHHQHPQVAKQWPAQRDVPDALTQRTLVPCLSLGVPA